MEVWDDEPDNSANIIDRFVIAILGTVSAVNESGPTIIEGVNKIGNLTIAYYNSTTDDQLRVVPSCSSAEISTTTITSSTSKNNTQFITCDCYIYVWLQNLHVQVPCISYTMHILYNMRTIGINTVWNRSIACMTSIRSVP